MLKLWIWISAAASAAGWLLSAVHQLNVGGYVIAAAVTVALGVGAQRARLPRAAEDRRTPKPRGWSQWLKSRASVVKCGLDLSGPLLHRRFTRPLPLLFLTLAFLVFLSGMLYAPSNHMGLTYRLPRVLHWLTNSHWYWVHAPDPRINDRACDNEWLIAPILLFTHSDRAIFLLNFIPFLLLPGLIFSLWTRLGVRPRVAWYWMWLLPTGYVFLLQAASISNDAFPTVYGLAALDFALRARASRRFSDIAYSVVSIALLTGSKGSNLPLLLPWAIALLSALPAFANGFGLSAVIRGFLELWRTRPMASALIILISATISFLPTAVLNVHYCHDWSGANIETQGIAVKNPIVGIWGNGLLLLKNFVPPLFPKAKWWNEHALDVLPHAVTKPMNTAFERGYWGIGEIPTEDWAGIGFGVSVLLVVSLLAVPFCRRGKALEDQGTPGSSRKLSASSYFRQVLECGGPPPLWIRSVLLASPWLSLAAYAMNCGMVEAPRLIAPYYPLLFPSLLISCKQAVLVRKRWWRAVALGLALLALPVLIISPARPLWPAKSVLSHAVAKHPNSQGLRRALSVYTVYGGRSDPLANVRAFLPQDAKVVGFMGTEDDMPISLWRPYLQRRVENVLVSDSPDDIRKTGVKYIVVSGLNLEHHGIQLNDWLTRARAELIESTTATVKVSDGPQPWYIVRLSDR